MMEDIVGDYKDKTVTLEDFPYFSNNIKMASVHPCKHASVMKVLLDRADAALKIRLQKHRAGKASTGGLGMEGLEADMGNMGLTEKDRAAFKEGAKAGGNGNDEWEVLQHEADANDGDQVAIRVDQYLVVFLVSSFISMKYSITDKWGRNSWRRLHLALNTTSQWVFRVISLQSEETIDPAKKSWGGFSIHRASTPAFAMSLCVLTGGN